MNYKYSRFNQHNYQSTLSPLLYNNNREIQARILQDIHHKYHREEGLYKSHKFVIYSFNKSGRNYTGNISDYGKIQRFRNINYLNACNYYF